MKTHQTFDFKKDWQNLPSEIQVARNSVKTESMQKTRSKELTFNDLRGLSWIMLEEEYE